MDDLDRMFRRLVQNVRAAYPDYLAQPFDVSELYQVLVPYRHNRRELEIETNQDYETALLRLLAGERGYLLGDESMQQSIQHELQAKNPDTGLFRAYATNQVSMSPEAVRRLEQQPLIGNLPTANAAAAPPRSLTPTIPPVPRKATTPPAPVPAPYAPPLAPPLAPPPTSAAPRAPDASAQPPVAPRPPAPPRPAPSAQPTNQPTNPTDSMSAQRPLATVEGGGKCRFCGGTLPEGRRITFCPHCGENLTIRHCPACSSELQVGWKYCTTCGRAVGEETAAGAT
jgi:hypothetical protein